MRMLKILKTSLLSLLSVSCQMGCFGSPNPEDWPTPGVGRGPGATKVEYVEISKAEPPSQCQFVSAVEQGRFFRGYSGYGGTLTGLREKAKELGANYVVLDATYGAGRAFWCPPEEPRPARARASSADEPPPRQICEPDCSPGYACVRRRCVSACNPPCSAVERCGTDRICHTVQPGA